MWVIKHKTRDVYFFKKRTDSSFAIISSLYNASVYNNYAEAASICTYVLPKSWMSKNDSRYDPLDFKVHKVSVKLVNSTKLVE